FYRRILGLRRIKNLIKFIDGEIPALFIEDERLKKILAFNGVDLQVFISGKKETKKTIISVSITTTILKEFDKVVDKKKSNRSKVIEKLMKYYISKYCKN
ncbi:CopG family ribbon-helix-helix protein, partial [Helicobacter pullorum]